jgi:hypothetical protein
MKRTEIDHDEIQGAPIENEAVDERFVTNDDDPSTSSSDENLARTSTPRSQPVVLIAQAVLQVNHNIPRGTLSIAQQPAVMIPTHTFPQAQQNMSMNMAIDRAVAQRQQRRQQMLAAGAVVVEDSSSIGIDLDRVDAFYQNLGQRTYCSNFFRRYVNRYFRCGILLMGMAVAWIVTIPFLLVCTALGLDSDFKFEPAFPFAFIAYVLILMGIVQPLGAGIVYATNQAAESMLPRRRGGGRLTLVLLSGACCFCDDVLSMKQFWYLFTVQVSHSSGLIMCGAAALRGVAAFLTLLGLQLNRDDDDDDDDDATVIYILMWIGFTLPAIAWYRLCKRLHMYYLARREGASPSYNIVTADAINDGSDGSRDLDLV